MDNCPSTPFLDPNRPLPQLAGQGLDAIVDRGKSLWPLVAPTQRARLERYENALAVLGEGPDHDRRAVHGAELQANVRAYGTTIELRLLARAMCRQDLAWRRLQQVAADAYTQGRVLHLKGGRRG